MLKEAKNINITGYVEFECYNCGSFTNMRLEISDLSDCVSQIKCIICDKWNNIES